MTNRDPLSMSTDNTPEGEMYSDTVEGGPISLVEIGDRVVDAAGTEVGKVKFVKMGDPTAATTKGQEGYETSFLGWRLEGGLDMCTWSPGLTSSAPKANLSANHSYLQIIIRGRGCGLR